MGPLHDDAHRMTLEFGRVLPDLCFKMHLPVNLMQFPGPVDGVSDLIYRTSQGRSPRQKHAETHNAEAGELICARDLFKFLGLIPP